MHQPKIQTDWMDIKTRPVYIDIYIYIHMLPTGDALQN